MMERIDMELSGGCQCGAVRYHTTQILDNAHICHCRMCQKAVGNFFAALVGMPMDKFTWTRGEPAIFMSSEHVARGFCNSAVRRSSSQRQQSALRHHHRPIDRPEKSSCTTSSAMRANCRTRVAHLARRRGYYDRRRRSDFAANIRRTTHQHPDHDTDIWPPTSTA